MTEVVTGLDAGYVRKAGEKTRLLAFNDLDGRTTAVRRVLSWESQVANDLGGGDTLSEAQRALVRRGAVLAAVLEDYEAKWASGAPLDLSAYLPGANTLRRLLLALGLQRCARPVSSSGGLPALLDGQ